MKIYVDENKRCHASNPDGRFREVEMESFNGKCRTFIEGFVYDDSKGYGQVYPGKPYAGLDAAQRQYEQALIADMQNALNKLGVTLHE